MKKTFLSLVLCLLLAQVAYSQSQVIVKLSPFSLLHLNHPSLNAGVEFKPIPRMGLSADYGLSAPMFFPNRFAGKGNFRSHMLISDVRFYVDRDQSFFVGSEFFTYLMLYSKNNEYYYEDNTRIEYAQSDITIDQYGFRLMAGYQKEYANRFVFEMFTALGPRRVHIQHNAEITQVESNVVPDYGHYPGISDQFPGKENRLSFRIGIKLGIRMNSI
ncbi:hypothetical protein QWY31_06950 [Cytophagales bacterium LB-30]|uniref:DUF3575 domain-containing protein n=1 Tax=Shiella aurantiaca TaxID=3058365 RepID=A0ABT8F5J0_9BACT|nr:hypothetical protein [Shiella aurantiaca]MDN4165231.1 hypothetical protein [Shiella aurantiaca]